MAKANIDLSRCTPWRNAEERRSSSIHSSTRHYTEMIRWLHFPPVYLRKKRPPVSI